VGAGNHTVFALEEYEMCPVCIAAATQAAIGATSAGAWTALVIKKLRTKFTANVIPEIKVARRVDHE
jgi:hypothetical protein